MATRVKVHVQPQPSIPESEALSGELIEAYLTDIGRFGMGLLTHSALPQGVLVDLEFPRAAGYASERRRAPTAGGPVTPLPRWKPREHIIHI